MKKIIEKYDRPGKWEETILFEKSGDEKEWLGIVDARESGKYDLKVIADHSVEKTKGRIAVRAVVGAGASVSVFGMIKIRKPAQDTDDFLDLRVLMLDKSARANIDPVLEIEANNVKASHSASVGQVDKEQILYLMTKGLSEKGAIDEIVKGWLS